jgi:hypothetical protein
MNLDRYIQGIRTGRDINYLEREAMLDSFLADALEGYDHVNGEHAARIDAMKKQIIQQTRSKKNLLFYWSVAAVILGLIAIGVYCFRNNSPLSTVVIPTPVVQEKPDTIQLDSLHVTDYFFNKQDISFLIPVSSFFTETSPDSLLGPLIIPKTDGEKTDEKPEEKPEITAVYPKPAVGYKEYESYLKREMIRPVDGDCENVKGKVVLTFSINGNGRPYDINISKSLCPAADAEAVRLLKEGPGWISGDKNARIEVRF